MYMPNLITIMTILFTLLTSSAYAKTTKTEAASPDLNPLLDLKFDTLIDDALKKLILNDLHCCPIRSLA